MTILEDPESLKTLDSDSVLETIGHFPKQLNQAWDEASRIEIPANFRDINNITFCGMGGSALGPHLITSLYQNKVKKPMLIFRDYELPGYVNNKSLVFLCSYSGNTEETLACGAKAVERGAKILAVTSGGDLAKFMQDNSFPHYQFNPTYNTSAPRYGSGYLTIGLLAMLTNLRLIRIKRDEINSLIRWLTKKDGDYQAQVKQEKNPAKKTALMMRHKVPILIGAEFLEGAVHVFTNQVNETGKNFAAYFSIPELNHHLLEGLKFPKINPDNLIFLFIHSPLYSPPIRKRFEITQEVVKQHQINYLEFVPHGQSKLKQAFETVQFGSYVTFYLAMLNVVDPSPNPWVDYFKRQLKDTHPRHP